MIWWYRQTPEMKARSAMWKDSLRSYAVLCLSSKRALNPGKRLLKSWDKRSSGPLSGADSQESLFLKSLHPKSLLAITFLSFLVLPGWSLTHTKSSFAPGPVHTRRMSPGSLRAFLPSFALPTACFPMMACGP